MRRIQSVYMNKFILLLSFCLISFYGSSQVLNGTATLSASNNMTVDIIVDIPQNEVTLVFTGTNNSWFGFGFGGTQMFNRYSIITTGAGAVSERKLGNHSAGTLLTSSLTSINTTVAGSIRTVTVKRPIAGMNSNYFSFPTSPGSFMMIWAKGNGMNLANHGGGNRGSSLITLSNACVSTTNQLSPLHICLGDSTLFAGNYISSPGVYRDTLSGSSGCDSIVVQSLSVSNPGPYIQNSLSFCAGDSLLVFGRFVNQAGNYFDTLQASNGCDSILSQNVTENQVNYSINYQLGQGTITAVANGASYQWLENCDSMPSPIIGATDSTLVNPSSGNASYAVIVTIDGCSDTSDCIEYSYNFNLAEGSNILTSTFPNPFENQLNIELESSYQNIKIAIFSLEGKLIKKFTFDEGQKNISLDLGSLSNGPYILKLDSDSKSESKMIFKN